VVDILSICCQKLFGYIPDDLMIEFNPLRILNAKEEEEVKDSQFNRVMGAYNTGLIDAKAAKASLNKDSLLGVEVDEDSPALPPVDGGQFEVSGAKGEAGGAPKAPPSGGRKNAEGKPVTK
jgi:hypothetical protein